MTDSKKKKIVLFVYRTKRGQALEDYKQGKGPDHILYGFNYFQKDVKFSATFSDINYSFIGKLLQLASYPIEWIFIKIHGVGFKISQAFLLLPLIYKSDVIFATTDSCGLPVLFLKKIGLITKPVVYVSIGLMNNTKKYNQTSLVIKSLLSQADQIITYSREEMFHIQKITGKKVNMLAPPVDTNFFSGRISSHYLLSVGADESRDFETFISSLSIKMNNIVIITIKSRLNKQNYPNNTQIFFNINYETLKSYYLKSKLIVIPLIETGRASGQLVFLEALSANKPVIISKIESIVDLGIQASSFIKYVEPQNPVALRSTIESVITQLEKTPQEIRHYTIAQQFSSKIYYLKLKAIINKTPPHI